MSEVSESVKSKKQWLRGLFMLLFMIVVEIVKVIINTVAVIQFLFAILTGKGNRNLTRFGSSMAQFVQQIVDFLTYNSDEKPFPFAAWPEAVVVDEEPEMEFGTSADATGDVVEEPADEAVEAAEDGPPAEDEAEQPEDSEEDTEEETKPAEGEVTGEQEDEGETDKKPGA